MIKLALRLRRRPSLVAGILICACVLALWLWRVQRAVDLSDESYYLALPMRFALGDRPFLDDRSALQGAGILTTPLVLAYHLVVRSNAGLVLFMRLAYVAYLAGIALAIARAVRGWLSPGGALACGVVACFYVPYCITQFSYNTVGGGLALLAATSSLRVARSKTAEETTRHAVLTGLAAAGSALAYPTLVVLFPVHLVLLVLFGRAQLGAVRVALRFLVGAALIGVYVGLFLVRSGLGSLRLTLDFIRAAGPGLSNSPMAVISGLDGMKNDWFSSIAVAGIITAVAARFRPAVLILAIAAPFLAAPTTVPDVADSMRFFSCCALFAPFFAPLVRDKKTAFRVLALLWAPGMLTGFVMGCSSGNVWNACGLGGFAAMIAGVLLACRACEEAVGTFRFLAAPAGLAAPIALLWALGGRVVAPTSVYRDLPPKELDARVRSGPFLGLFTTPHRRDLAEEMHRDIVANAHGRFVLFLQDLPSAYLSANARAAVPDLWPIGISGRAAIDARIFRERLPEIGLVMVRTCETTRNWRAWEDCTPTLDLPNDALQAAVLETYIETSRRPGYSVWKRR